MLATVVTGLLWFAALGCGAMGGLYFAFSTFIMSALEQLEHPGGLLAMNAINTTIVRSVFMPLFVGTTLASVALVVLGLARAELPGARLMLAGGAIYVVGMFVVTAAGNVPLNDALLGVDPSSGAAAVLWQRYLRMWTAWNHLRTVASLGASALFVAALRR